jgi:hypothetical protein
MTLASDGHLCGHIRTVVPTNSFLNSLNIQQTPAKVHSSIVWVTKCNNIEFLVTKMSEFETGNTWIQLT